MQTVEPANRDDLQAAVDKARRYVDAGHFDTPPHPIMPSPDIKPTIVGLLGAVDAMMLAPPMRRLILARITEIRDTFGADRFAKSRTRKQRAHGKFPNFTHWDHDHDFNQLDDAALLAEFERVCRLCYMQR